jgi:hypothetical protein
LRISEENVKRGKNQPYANVEDNQANYRYYQHKKYGRYADFVDNAEKNKNYERQSKVYERRNVS